MDSEATLRVTVAFSPQARVVREVQIDLPVGSTVSFAVQASGLVKDLRTDVSEVGIWGRKTTLETAVSGGDRIEVYRPLLVDPKVARRERFKKQGSKAAGLFASRRAGAKAGY